MRSPWADIQRRIIAELVRHGGIATLSDFRKSKFGVFKAKRPHLFYEAVRKSDMITRVKRGLYALRVMKRARCRIHEIIERSVWSNVGWHNVIMLGGLKSRSERLPGKLIGGRTNLRRYESRIPLNGGSIGFTVSLFPVGSAKILFWDERPDRVINCLAQLYELLRNKIIRSLGLLDLVIMRAVELTVLTRFCKNRVPLGWSFSARRISENEWELCVGTDVILFNDKLWTEKDLTMVKAYVASPTVMRVEGKFGGLFTILPNDTEEFETYAMTLLHNALLPVLQALSGIPNATLRPLNAQVKSSVLIPALHDAARRLRIIILIISAIHEQRRRKRAPSRQVTQVC